MSDLASTCEPAYIEVGRCQWPLPGIGQAPRLFTRVRGAGGRLHFLLAVDCRTPVSRSGSNEHFGLFTSGIRPNSLDLDRVLPPPGRARRGIRSGCAARVRPFGPAQPLHLWTRRRLGSPPRCLRRRRQVKRRSPLPNPFARTYRMCYSLAVSPSPTLKGPSLERRRLAGGRATR